MANIQRPLHAKPMPNAQQRARLLTVNAQQIPAAPVTAACHLVRLGSWVKISQSWLPALNLLLPLGWRPQGWAQLVSPLADDLKYLPRFSHGNASAGCHSTAELADCSCRRISCPGRRSVLQNWLKYICRGSRAIYISTITLYFRPGFVIQWKHKVLDLRALQRHCKNVFEANLHDLRVLTFNLVYPSRLAISECQIFCKAHLLLIPYYTLVQRIDLELYL